VGITKLISSEPRSGTRRNHPHLALVPWVACAFDMLRPRLPNSAYEAVVLVAYSGQPV